MLVGVVLNPGMRDFKEAAPTSRELLQEYPVKSLTSVNDKQISFRSERNFLVCSIYRLDYVVNIGSHFEKGHTAKPVTRRYLGIAKNFFLMAE